MGLHETLLRIYKREKAKNHSKTRDFDFSLYKCTSHTPTLYISHGGGGGGGANWWCYGGAANSLSWPQLDCLQVSGSIPLMKNLSIIISREKFKAKKLSSILSQKLIFTNVSLGSWQVSNSKNHDIFFL